MENQSFYLHSFYLYSPKLFFLSLYSSTPLSAHLPSPTPELVSKVHFGTRTTLHLFVDSDICDAAEQSLAMTNIASFSLVGGPPQAGCIYVLDSTKGF